VRTDLKLQSIEGEEESREDAIRKASPALEGPYDEGRKRKEKKKGSEAVHFQEIACCSISCGQKAKKREGRKKGAEK